jgi:hypothetical protein
MSLEHFFPNVEISPNLVTLLASDINSFFPSSIATQYECDQQGDQIGRNSLKNDRLLWAVFSNDRNSQQFWATFFQSIYLLCIHFDKKWVGLHFGRFFSLAHPVTQVTSLSRCSSYVIFFSKNPNSASSRLNNVSVRVARWFVFKPKIPIWVNFGGP